MKVQQSGITKNDFTGVIDYVVTSEDGTNTKTYKVKVIYDKDIKYASNKFNYGIGEYIDIQKTNTIFSGFVYSISPSLPSGLVLNTSTGAITGKSLLPIEAKDYNVIAIKDGRKLSAILNIEIVIFQGEGTQAKPYLISSAIQLDSVRNHLKSHFNLKNKIDLDIDPYNKNKGWVPIGHPSETFEGVFDGKGFTIDKLFIDDNNLDKGAGLFRRNGGTIKDLKLTNAYVKAKKSIGILSGKNIGNIEKIFVEDAQIITSGSFVGGITGVMSKDVSDPLVSKCYVKNLNISSTGNAAGIQQIGNIVGVIWNGGKIELSYSHNNKMNIVRASSLNSYIGGILGGIAISGVIENSYSLGGTITASNSGIIGAILGGVGFNGADKTKIRVKNCYSTDTIKNGSNLNYGNAMEVFTSSNSNACSNIISIFYNTDIGKSGGIQTASCATKQFKVNGYVMGKNTGELKQISTYTTGIVDNSRRWDFNNVWNIDASKNNGYPYLRWE